MLIVKSMTLKNHSKFQYCQKLHLYKKKIKIQTDLAFGLG